MCEEGRREMDTHATEEEQADGDSQINSEGEAKIDAHKNGIHLKFSNRAAKKFFWPRRYSKSVKPTLPIPGKTTTHARRISNE